MPNGIIRPENGHYHRQQGLYAIQRPSSTLNQVAYSWEEEEETQGEEYIKS